MKFNYKRININNRKKKSAKGGPRKARRKEGRIQKLDKIGLKEIYKGRKCIRAGGGFKG